MAWHVLKVGSQSGGQFMGGQSGMVVQKRMSFLASAVWALACVTVTGMVCVAGVAVHGLRIFDRRFDDTLGFVHQVLEGLDSLPPMLADAIDYRRQPEYREHLRVDVDF